MTSIDPIPQGSKDIPEGGGHPEWLDDQGEHDRSRTGRRLTQEALLCPDAAFVGLLPQHRVPAEDGGYRHQQSLLRDGTGREDTQGRR